MSEVDLQLLPYAVHLNKKIQDEYEAKTAGALGIGHLNRDGGLAKRKSSVLIVKRKDLEVHGG